MNSNLRFDLLERVHDGEASEKDQHELDLLLVEDPDAMEYLGMLDNFADLLREEDAAHLESVSFDGLWDGVHAQIQSDSVKSAPVENMEPAGFFERLKAFFKEHSSSWVTAAATAGAVAAVLLFMGPGQNTAPTSNDPLQPNLRSVAQQPSSNAPNALVPVSNRVQPTPKSAQMVPSKGQRVVQKIVEKHYIYVDSVNSTDSDSTVVVNSQEDGSAVIWLLPEDAEAKPKAQPKNSKNVQIQEESL